MVHTVHYFHALALTGLCLASGIVRWHTLLTQGFYIEMGFEKYVGTEFPGSLALSQASLEKHNSN